MSLAPFKKWDLLIPLDAILTPQFGKYPTVHQLFEDAAVITINDCIILAKTNPFNFRGNSQPAMEPHVRKLSKLYHVNSLGVEPKVTRVGPVYLPVNYWGGEMRIENDFLKDHSIDFWYEVPTRDLSK